jgi:serine/threonine protein kinase
MFMDSPQGKSNGITEQAAPERLGKYPLLSVIGKGSMGIIYKSVDPHIKRSVALKTIRRDLLVDDSNENFSARFRIEAQAAGGLAHPGIVAVYEYGEEGAFAYIAMEYVEGRSLRECFEQKAAFSVAQVVNILAQLLDALQYAHERGVWHRDIKPANILIMSNGQVKVTDFGIARIESSMLTQVGAIMGTPGFIAPEMYLCDAFDSRIDVFAAGVVLYQLLAGAPPFVGTAEKVMFKVCYETPLPPSVAGRLPSLQPFDAVVLKALAKRPEDRFATAAHFLAALRQAQEHVGGPGSDETIIQPRPSIPGAPSIPGGAASIPGALSIPGVPRESVSQPPSTNTLAGAGWNMEELGQIEKKLARFIGPIAKVMVRRAAKETGDFASLTQWLAEKINSPLDRREFLKQTGIGPAPAWLPPRSTPDPASIGEPRTDAPARRPNPLTPEDITRASRLLAIYIGPIAPVVAKRAAKPGSSRDEFIAALAAQLSDADRMRFLDSLR